MSDKWTEYVVVENYQTNREGKSEVFLCARYEGLQGRGGAAVLFVTRQQMEMSGQFHASAIVPSGPFSCPVIDRFGRSGDLYVSTFKNPLFC